MIIGIEASHANKQNRTGVEEYCFQIIQQLKKVIPSTAKVVLYSNKRTKNKEQRTSELFDDLPANWSVRELSWPLGKMWSQFRLSWEFLWHKPDVFFAPGQLVPFFCPKNTLVMIHDSAFMVYPQAYHFWGRQYLKWMNKRIVRVSKIILTSTEFNKKELARLYGKKIEAKIEVIPLGFDHSAYHITQNAERSGEVLKKYGITKPYILSVGRLEEKKNTRRIVEAFDLLRKSSKFPAISSKLVLVGKPGAGYELVQKAIDESPFKDDIIIPGYVNQNDLPVLYAGAALFLFPSLYEGFGLPILEALASGCLVITSKGSALEEVGGKAVLYVDPQNTQAIGEAIGQLLGSPEKMQELRQNASQQAEKFSWEKTALQTWQKIAKIADI